MKMQGNNKSLLDHVFRRITIRNNLQDTFRTLYASKDSQNNNDIISREFSPLSQHDDNSTIIEQNNNNSTHHNEQVHEKQQQKHKKKKPKLRLFSADHKLSSASIKNAQKSPNEQEKEEQYLRIGGERNLNRFFIRRVNYLSVTNRHPQHVYTEYNKNQQLNEDMGKNRVKAPSYYIGHLNNSLVVKEGKKVQRSSHHFKGNIKDIRRYQENTLTEQQKALQKVKDQIKVKRKKDNIKQMIMMASQLNDNNLVEKSKQHIIEIENINVIQDDKNSDQIRVIPLKDTINAANTDSRVGRRELSNSSQLLHLSPRQQNNSQLLVIDTFSQNIKLSTPRYSNSNHNRNNTLLATNQHSNIVTSKQSLRGNNDQFNDQVLTDNNIVIENTVQQSEGKFDSPQINFQNPYLESKRLVTVMNQLKDQIDQRRPPHQLVNIQVSQKNLNKTQNFPKKRNNRYLRSTGRYNTIRDSFIEPLKDHMQCENMKNKRSDDQLLQSLQQELNQDKANMLIDIVSPLHSEQAFRLIKQKEKMRKIIEARHQIEFKHLMKGFDTYNPVKKIKERFNNKRGLLFDEFETFKSFSFNINEDQCIEEEDSSGQDYQQQQ